jgi:hypothetical protein
VAAQRSARRVGKQAKLRLIDGCGAKLAAPVEADRQAFKQFCSLTQRLVEISIEMTEIIAGDPDLEPIGDEEEDSDGGI